jgi:hypothetical protein
VGKLRTCPSANSLFILLLLVFMTCGYLISYLRFAKPRGFKGDFYAAMYDPSWWDGQGIFYGPIFVLERWIVNSFPNVVSVQFFALTYLILIVVCLLIAINTIKARGKLLVFCVAIWSLNTSFYYGFSVAANPEILELFFLLSMWWSLANKHLNLAYFLFTCAVLTKLAPAILAPILLLYFSWSRVALSAFTALFLFSVVSIGQKQSLLESLTQTLAINPSDPQPTSEQFLGLSSALSRLFGLNANSNFYAVETVSLIALLLLYVWAVLALKRLYKLRTDFAHREIVAYTFALFMTLLPLMHLGQAHRHTFIFLAPVFLAMKYLTIQIKDLKKRRRWNHTFNIIFLAYTFLPLYGLDIYNFDDLEGVIFFEEFQSTLVMLTEPVWINILLFLIVLKFGNDVMSLRVRQANVLPLSARLLRFRTL